MMRSTSAITALSHVTVAAIAFGAALYLGQEVLLIAFTVFVIVGVTILRRPILGLYLSFMLIPLEAAGRVFPTNAYLTWAKVVLIITTLALLQHLLVEGMPLKLPRAGLNLYFVLLLALIATAAWPQLGDSMWGIVAFAGQAMIVILGANLIKGPREFENCVLAIVAGSVVVTSVGLLDVFLKRSTLGTFASQLHATAGSSMFRVTATFYDPNTLGRYMVFAIVMTICVLRFTRVKKMSPFLLFLLAPQAFVLLNTFSRGSLLSLGAVIPLLLLWERRARQRLATAALVVLAGGAVFAIASRAINELLIRLTGGGATLEVDSIRVMIYEMGLRAFWLSPVFGFGPDNVPRAIGQFYFMPLSPHSIYLETLLATGALGFVIFAWFVTAQLIVGLRTRRTEFSDYARPAVIGLAVVLLTGITLHGFKSNELWASLALLAALPGVTGRRSTGETACE